VKRKDCQDRQLHQAKPITLPMLEEACRTLENDNSLRTWRTVWRMVICYFGFLRFDDIKRVKVSDLEEKNGSQGPYFRMKLIGGKTNQLNRPDHVVIASAPGPICPYTLTKRYTSIIGKTAYLQPYCLASDRTRPDLKKGSIYYTSALADLRNVLTGLGYDGNEFSEHSLKRGVATDSDAAGIPENEIQEEGGWTNVQTTRRYIDKKDTKSVLYTRKLIAKLL